MVSTNPFSITVAQWHDFYIMVGTAAATLVGLLFVGLALNIDLLRREESRDLQRLAALTFNSFIYALLFAVLFLIPGQSPLGLGLPLLGIGAFGLYSMTLLFVNSRESRRTWGRGAITRRFLIPFGCHVGVLVVAVFVVFENTDILFWLVPIMLLLLAGASRNAWDLLFGERSINR